MKDSSKSKHYGKSKGDTPSFRRMEDVRDGQGTGHVPFESLPELTFSPTEMVLFDPAVHLSDGASFSSALDDEECDKHTCLCALRDGAPFPNYEPVETEGMGRVGSLALLALAKAAKIHPDIVFIPREEDCYALWERYCMPRHIALHSQLVADLAQAIAREAALRGKTAINPAAVYASGLLHDLGKAYCIAHGGNHAQLGASWVMRETRNGPVAQGVLFHVHWPWEERVEEDTLLIMALIYADKRVKHTAYVGLEERFQDLLVRYGITESARNNIEIAHLQGVRIEEALSERLGIDLRDYTVRSGKLCPL